MTNFIAQPVLCKLVVGAVFMQMSVLIYAETIFVDPDGNDDNSGSSSSPVKTIVKAVDLAADYDVIFIRSGQYELSETVNIFHKNNITLTADKNEKPQLNFTAGETYGILIGEDSIGITIDGLSIGWSSVNDGNVIGIAGNDISIRNNHIYFDRSKPASKYDGIKILSTADNVLVEDNEINDAPQQCIDSVGGTGITIRRNLMYRCRNAVVLKGGASHNLIENNKILDMKYGAIGVGGFTAPRFIDKDYSNLDTVVHNNFIYYTDGNNIGGGIFLRGAVASNVYNNTVIGAGIHIKAGGDPENPTLDSKNNRIIDNIIWTTGNDGIVIIETNNDVDLLLENNCYWREDGSGEFRVNEVWYGYNDFKERFNFDVNSILSNPGYMNNFVVPDDSPCSGRGIKSLLNKHPSALLYDNGIDSSCQQ